MYYQPYEAGLLNRCAVWTKLCYWKAYFFQATFVLDEEEGDPIAIAVHPSGDDIVCYLSNGSCKWASIAKNFGFEAFHLFKFSSE